MEIKELLYNVGRKKNVISIHLDYPAAVRQMETKTIDKTGITLLQLREALFGLGTILEENLEEKYYLSTIRIGTSGAVLIARLLDNTIEMASYAKEGLIKQHLAKRAISEFISKLIQ